MAIVGALVSALFAAQFAAGVLGPDEVDESNVAFIAVAKGMVDGGRAALRVPSVAAGFIALTAHRIAYGASLLVIVLLMKFALHSQRHAARRRGRADRGRGRRRRRPGRRRFLHARAGAPVRPARRGECAAWWWPASAWSGSACR